MKLGQLIRMGGLALALATGMAGCDDDDPGKADAKPDATTDAIVDTGKPDTTTETGTEVPKLDAADGGSDAADVSSEVGDDTSSEAGTDSAAD